MVYVFGLTAACLLGAGFVLQQHAAERAPASDVLRFRLLWDLAHSGLWLGGIGCMVAGQLLSAVALANGDLSQVEPLLVTNLLFAFALARWLSGQRLGASGWAGSLMLGGGVAAFTLAGRPSGGTAESGTFRQWTVIGLVIGVAFALIVLARHLPRLDEPPFLATAAGMLYGLQDALTRVSLSIVGTGGVVVLLTGWQPYAVIALAVTGLMLVQSAFETGPLRMSLPALTAAEPLAGIACGIGFLGDRLRTDALALTWEVVGLAAVVAGVFVLARHPAMPGQVAKSRELDRR
ncbi:DMT family transporter [Streptomyces sediminimaris]|uniref:DMT family transporter n=1 Tax=Streptomyces sediminimaris TaxID=3383721 RepID=UPI00399B68D0